MKAEQQTPQVKSLTVHFKGPEGPPHPPKHMQTLIQPEWVIFFFVLHTGISPEDLSRKVLLAKKKKQKQKP